MAKLTRISIPVMLLIGLSAFVHACTQAGGSKEPEVGLQSLAVGEMSLLQFRDEVPPQPSEPILGPDDNEVRLSDFEGVVVVNFWGTFCPPCVAEMPTLADLQSKYDPDKLKVVAITADNRQDIEKARKQLAELSDDRLDFFYDPQRGIIYDSAVGGFPTTIVYGPDGKEISIKPKKVDQTSKRLWGMNRSLLNNAIIGTSKGYEKTLELVGVGYRAALKGKQLNLQLGFSHDVNYDIPENIKITVEKQTTLKISGSDKQEVGMVASKIKSYRPPEPYKGKGIKEKGQYILRKEGKKK